MNERRIIEAALKRTFAPEFVNRIDEVVVFDPLEKYHIEQIIEIELKKLFDRVGAMGYRIDITDRAKELIVSQGYDKQYGARPLKRAVQRFVEDVVAEEIINGRLKHGDSFMIDSSQDGKSTLLVMGETHP